MSLPGPSGFTWAGELLLLAAAFLPAGELLRRTAARWVSFFRDLGWVERVLLDLYLGGGGLYALAVVPLGLFGLPLLGVYLGGAALILLVLVVRQRLGSSRAGLAGFLPTGTVLLPGLLVVAATVVLFAIELFVAEGVPTGNSYDTSLLADYVSLLLLHHQVPVSLAPLTPQLTSYPQGTTVWLAAAQLTFSLPPARTPLLVTPLFLSLSPLAGYVLGRRQLNSPWAGVTMGLTFALIASWTRVMVATSNDFVFAFPLVLWLLARVDVWRGTHAPAWPDALAYAAVLGYSAALNPVGAEWLFPAFVILGLAAGGVSLRYLRTAVPRWLGALAVSLLFVTPTLWTLVRGRGMLFATYSGIIVPGPTEVPGISPAQFVGSVDPFLFGPQAIWLSPFVALRFELAVLLVAGAAVLVLPYLFTRLGSSGPAFRQLAVTTFLVVIVILFLEVGAREGLGALDRVVALSSPVEMSVYLFTLYAVLAAIPVYLLVEYLRQLPRPSLAAGGRETRTSVARRGPPSITGPQAIGLALVVVLLVPGIVVTGTDFPPYLQQLYGSYGRVTPSDFAMLEWARHGLPTGSHVLVAPGSAAQFLAGYVNVELIFPVQPIAQNASYVDLDRQLVQGRLNGTGVLEIGWLGVQYIAVTGNTTNLWAPFSPAPLLLNPLFALRFQQGDAYVFQVT